METTDWTQFRESQPGHVRYSDPNCILKNLMGMLSKSSYWKSPILDKYLALYKGDLKRKIQKMDFSEWRTFS